MKRSYKSTIFLVLIIGTLILMFTNDLGIIEIEKTAIITALAVDKESEDFIVTAQIALPEAAASSSKNEKTVISGSAPTVSEALKRIGATTGWYPKLAFCNLVLIGEEMLGDNIIYFLDYLANTLKIQYSTVIAGCEGQAKDYLEISTPLDNISSFSLQKIILKGTGHLQDVATTNLKEFCVGYYSKTHSAFMPLVKKVPVTSGSGSGGGADNSSNQGADDAEQRGGSVSSGGSQSEDSETCLFDISNTLLFDGGKAVGKLNTEQTQVFNMIRNKIGNSYYGVKDVTIDGETFNVLLTVISNDTSLSMSFDDGTPRLKLSDKYYVRIDDKNSVNTELTRIANVYVQPEIKKKAEEQFTKTLTELIEISKTTKCDFLKLKEHIYRHHHDKYEQYAENVLDTVSVEYEVEFYGQAKQKNGTSEELSH